MSGKPGRSGRKALPLSDHLLRGTYRPSRHGPLPEAVKRTAGRDIPAVEKPLTPPSHLSPEAGAWWARIATEYELDDHHVLLLTAAAESWDSAQKARQAIADQGQTFIDRFKTPKPRPEVGIEHDAVLRFARLLAQLGLDAAADAPETPTVPIVPIPARDRSA